MKFIAKIGLFIMLFNLKTSNSLSLLPNSLLTLRVSNDTSLTNKQIIIEEWDKVKIYQTWNISVKKESDYNLIKLSCVDLNCTKIWINSTILQSYISNNGNLEIQFNSNETKMKNSNTVKENEMINWNIYDNKLIRENVKNKTYEGYDFPTSFTIWNNLFGIQENDKFVLYVSNDTHIMKNNYNNLKNSIPFTHVINIIPNWLIKSFLIRPNSNTTNPISSTMKASYTPNATFAEIKVELDPMLNKYVSPSLAPSNKPIHTNKNFTTTSTNNITVASSNNTVSNKNITVASTNNTVTNKNITVASTNNTSTNNTVSNKNITVASTNNTVSNKNITVASTNNTVSNKNITVASTNNTVSNKNITVASTNNTESNKNITVASTNNTVSNKNITVASTNNTESNKNITVASTNNTESNKNITVASTNNTESNKNITVASTNNTPVTNDNDKKHNIIELKNIITTNNYMDYKIIIVGLIFITIIIIYLKRKSFLKKKNSYHDLDNELNKWELPLSNTSSRSSSYNNLIPNF